MKFIYQKNYIKSMHLIGCCAIAEHWCGLHSKWANVGKWVAHLQKNKIDRAWKNEYMAKQTTYGRFEIL